jgi:hypothetical protein
MGVQRYVLRSGVVRYRARVKFHGREVATRVFERRADAIAWCYASLKMSTAATLTVSM